MAEIIVKQNGGLHGNVVYIGHKHFFRAEFRGGVSLGT